ncbi:MAG: hypothetical protein JWN44_5626 [Myxococcales bacterium]|nr:hypothetical protein [Myxococcales bacterium]
MKPALVRIFVVTVAAALAQPAAAQSAAPTSKRKPAAAAPRVSHFSFKVPDGWTDKSTADTRDFYTLAFDEANSLSFQAKVSPGGDRVTPEFLDKYASDAQRSVAQRLKGAELKVLEKKLVNIGGLTGARFVFEVPAPPDAEVAQEVRQVQYYVPAADQHAVLTFSAPRSAFDKFAPLFDKTAQATLIKR